MQNNLLKIWRVFNIDNYKKKFATVPKLFFYSCATKVNGIINM